MKTLVLKCPYCGSKKLDIDESWCHGCEKTFRRPPQIAEAMGEAWHRGQQAARQYIKEALGL